MFGWPFGTKEKKSAGADHDNLQLAAILNRVRAVIWFEPDGTILDANENFLNLMGYEKDEIVGKNHSMFCYKSFVASDGYKQMWKSLREGKTDSSEFPRVTKSGEVVWINATYNAVRDPEGKVIKIVKFATDVTKRREAAQASKSRIDAIHRSQAVIEFSLDGKIVTANENFLGAVGYSLDDIVGKHHSMFVFPEDRETDEYKSFWKELSAGKFKAGEFRRMDSAGKPLFLNATYNPVLNNAGKAIGVIKFASDITEAKQLAADARGQIAALGKSQAVIEFDLDGTIRHANDIFLDTLGYRLEEIVGKKHAMFVPPSDRASESYANFWHDLNNGQYKQGEFLRMRRDGSDLWIYGTYNPILDADGNPFKIVKFAVDITGRHHAVDTLSKALSHLASGMLNVSIDEKFTPEFDQLRQDFNSAGETLLETISQVINESGVMLGDISGIATSTQELGQRTERQAANLEETAAAMEELASMVQRASGTAGETSETVADAKQTAENGGLIVRQTVEAMAEISESSSKISKITSVIDEIAFQTNLLALNAGVEAARAGESGRGFSVVASEVRALAQRSSDAAREIANLISESTQQVNKGVDLVAKTGAALEEIQHGVSNVHEKVSGIVGLADQQNNAIREINTAVSDLDRMTQNNAAMFEEITAATHALKGTADGLVKCTMQFTLEAPVGTNDVWSNHKRTHDDQSMAVGS